MSLLAKLLAMKPPAEIARIAQIAEIAVAKATESANDGGEIAQIAEIAVASATESANELSPFDFIQDLWGRDFQAVVTHGGELILSPSDQLTEADNAYIQSHEAELIGLLRGGDNLHHLPNGWQQDEYMPERVMCVEDGRLKHSCLFHTEHGSTAYLELVNTGMDMTEAFNRACELEF